MIVQVQHEVLASDRENTSSKLRDGFAMPRNFSQFNPALPVDWLQAARDLPQLARILFESTFAAQNNAAFFEDWAVKFQRQPNWSLVADGLRRCSSNDGVNDVVLVAELSRSVAVSTGWASADSAFWTGLLRSKAEPIDDLILTAETSALARRPDLCVAVSEVLLNQIGRRTSAAVNSMSDAKRKYEFLNLRFPTVDWPGLAREAHELCELNSTSTLEPADRQLLLAWAEANAACEAVVLHSSLRQLAFAESLESILDVICTLMERFCRSTYFGWIREDVNGQTIGKRVMNLAAESSNVMRWDKREIETLEHEYPHRRDIRTKQGEVLGAIACADWIADDFGQHWLECVADAIVRWRCRNSADRNQIALGDRIRQLVECEVANSRSSFDQMIAEFSAGAGHEINNPLGTITGKTQSLLRDEVDPNRRKSLQKILEQVDRIHRMIRDLHFVGSHVRTEKSVVSLHDILSEAYSKATRDFSTHQLTFQQSDLDGKLFGNRAELVRLFDELIRNGAEAAGESGRVTMTVAFAAENSRIVEVHICDTGPGFTEKDRKHAFHPFYSGRSAGRGIGMGLCVVRRIADDHGVTILLGAGRPTKVTAVLPLHVE